MGTIDSILNRFGLGFEELTSAERQTLSEWTRVLDSNQLDVDAVKRFVHSLKTTVQNELDIQRRSTPNTWVGVLCLFIPFYGLLKKWYQDENKLFLEARLRNLSLIEAFLIGPKSAKEAVERAIAGMVEARGNK